MCFEPYFVEFLLISKTIEKKKDRPCKEREAASLELITHISKSVLFSFKRYYSDVTGDRTST